MSKTVLVSGAGVGGSTVAYWLAHNGFEVTVVERAHAQRSSGNPVDVKGPAIEVAEKMGILDRLQAAGSAVNRMTFVDAHGRPTAHIGLELFQGGAGDREVEIPRADLAAILLDTAREAGIEFLWGDTITGLRQDPDGVAVTFAHAGPRRFDAVIGADGLHSNVRRLAFGAEAEFVRHMGVYVATVQLDRPFGADTEVLVHNTPGRAVTVHPSKGRAVAAFMFRSAAVPGFDHRDLDQHKRLVTEAFPEPSWRLPELVERVRAADDLYFDSVSQVRMPSWSTGRIVLLGDAASCLSLFGDGSTLAMTGAYTLATAMAATDDPAEAFRRYERQHRTLVEPKLKGFSAATMLLLPATRAGIAARNAFTRVLPLVTTIGAARRRRNGAAATSGDRR
ncbi:FAD-dependent monooxygenase [Nocardia stercoris]|uniref:FAD-dependent oxidoreductase n=1 Tax=Nocardia stercoris TaxID=2483361 RepID=A0A3M2L494_9NOCA|nr:FAD-dependent monooxygenase [Nocardia stercoris]RMI31796.1 FAD-dependent oxidoreductase [Nocardia stercoris]